MSFKLNLTHLVCIVILLSIIYFVLQYKRDIKMEEGFINEIPENTNDRNYYSTNQSNSTYYPLQVDRNDVEEVDKVKNLFKKMNITSIQDLFNSITNLVHLDKWTGYWRNFDDKTTETSSGSGIFNQIVANIDPTKDNILVVRKVQDNIFFSLTRRAYLQNTYNSLTDLPNSRYMFVGRAQINSTNPNQADIVEIYQDTYNQDTNNTTINSERKGNITFIPKSGDEINDKISFTFNSNTITSFTKRDAIPKGVINQSDMIPYYYETTSTVFSDLQCPPDKEKCTFNLQNAENPTSYTGCIKKGGSTNGTCTITTNSDICYLNNLNNNEILNYPLGDSSTKQISKCNPNFYPLQNNSDYMINKFISGNKQCPSYLSDLTSPTTNTTYLVYYLYDTNNIVDLGYQIWGLGSHDSKLTTQRTILSNLLYQYMSKNKDFGENFVTPQLNMNKFNVIKDFKDITTINESTANNMITWKVDKLFNNSPSCFFKLSSKATSKKSNFYINYDNTKGTVGVSVLSGGNKNALMISNQGTYQSTDNYVKAYMGYLKNSSLFISPGSSVEQELNPFMGIQTNVCSLVSQMNVPGKWLIMKINPPSQKTFLDVLKGTA